MKRSINSLLVWRRRPPESKVVAPPPTLEEISAFGSDCAQRTCKPKGRSSGTEHSSRSSPASPTSVKPSRLRSMRQNHRTTFPPPCGRASRSRALHHCTESPAQSLDCCSRETRRHPHGHSAPPVVSTTGRMDTARLCTRPAALSPVSSSRLLDATAGSQDELSRPRSDIGNPSSLC